MLKPIIPFLAIIFPAVTLAQTANPVANRIRSAVGAPPLSKIGQIETPFYKIANWAIDLFWILTTVFVVWAAYLYLTAGGDEAKIDEAKAKLKYAVISAVIGLLASGIKLIVQNLLTGYGVNP